MAAWSLVGIRRNWREVVFRNPGQALCNGRSIFELELRPLPAMSVSENIFPWREPLAGLGGIDLRSMYNRAEAQTKAVIRAAVLAHWRKLLATLPPFRAPWQGTQAVRPRSCVRLDPCRSRFGPY
jgi:ABC-type sugar transport system ATPase subunit